MFKKESGFAPLIIILIIGAVVLIGGGVTYYYVTKTQQNIQNNNSPITVTSPNGGETWKAGETHDITWTSNGINNVRIWLTSNKSEGGSYPITESISASSGKYSWTIPSYGCPGSSCKIEIVGTDSSGVNPSDESDNFFSITTPSTNQTIGQPSITITSPKGDETWKIGETHTITWASTGLSVSDTVSITLIFPSNIASSSGIYADVMKGKTSNSGSFSWTIPNHITPGNGYILEISDNGSRISTKSNIFSIVAPSTTQTTNWKAYQSDEYGFQIQYPQNATFTLSPDPYNKNVLLSIMNGQSLGNAGNVNILSYNNITLDSCFNVYAHENFPSDSKQVLINGVNFYTKSFPDDAMGGQRAVEAYYITIHNNTCYILESLVSWHSIEFTHGATDGSKATPQELAQENALIQSRKNFVEGIIPTFKFTK